VRPKKITSFVVALFVITNTAPLLGFLESDVAPKRDAAVPTPAASSNNLRVAFCNFNFVPFFVPEIDIP
jgi:hypothetical protein